MSKIAVILDDLFEDREYTDPVQFFRASGHKVTTIGKEKGKVVKGKKKGTEVKIDAAIEDISADDFDALLIPGGYSPDRLRADTRAVEFVTAFMDAAKPVFAICHGPQLLISADRLKGRKVTCWRSIVRDVKNAGAEYEDCPVVIDGNLVTSRQVGDIPSFIEAGLSLLEVPEKGLPFCDRAATPEQARDEDIEEPCREQDE